MLNIGLLSCLIKRYLLTRKITRPDVHACVSYIITRIELRTNYHKDAHLNLDILFMKKIWMFALSSQKNRNNHIRTLFYEHKNHSLIILQQTIQLQRLKNIYTVLKGILNAEIYGSWMYDTFYELLW